MNHQNQTVMKRMSLEGWTDEQKRERRNALHAEWNRKHAGLGRQARAAWIQRKRLRAKPAEVEFHVYFIRCEGTNYFKIGRSKNITSRMRDLQIGCPQALSIHSSIKCASEADSVTAEHWFHQRLASSHVRGQGSKGARYQEVCGGSVD